MRSPEGRRSSSTPAGLPRRSALQLAAVAASALELRGLVRHVGRAWAIERLELRPRRGGAGRTPGAPQTGP